jgi:hypothetical protein
MQVCCYFFVTSAYGYPVVGKLPTAPQQVWSTMPWLAARLERLHLCKGFKLLQSLP